MSCGAEKEALTNTGPLPEDLRLVGKVRIGEKDACPFYLETFEGGKSITMYPVDLDDTYKIEGVKIKFDYTPSRAMQPENCIVDKVVSLNNVTLLR